MYTPKPVTEYQRESRFVIYEAADLLPAEVAFFRLSEALNATIIKAKTEGWSHDQWSEVNDMVSGFSQLLQAYEPKEDDNE